MAAEKNAARRGAHLAFLDESGFLLIPNVRKTWAPIGRTPHLRHSYRRDKVSVISALTVAPQGRRLGSYFDLHVRTITGAEVIRFLRQLVRHLRGSILLLWDGRKIHRRRDVQAFLHRYPRMEVHRFPS